MPNRIFLDDHGFINTVYAGDQTEQTISAGIKQTANLANQIRAQHRPILLLVDTTRVGKQDSGARHAGAEGLKLLDYDQAAAFGTNPLIRHLINLVIRAAGKSDKIKYFNTKAEAIGYLSHWADKHEHH